MNIEQIAHVAHEVNRAYCKALGDESQPDWFHMPLWQWNSVISGVVFHLHHPEAGPEASHENWLKEKLKYGWKYGPVKDAEKKEHPCIVPFMDLTREQQAKDFIFHAIVNLLKDL